MTTALDTLNAMRLSDVRSTPILLPYQQRWYRDESRLKIYEKTRRGGMTYAEAWRVVVTRISGKRPLDYWFSSKDESSAAEFALAVSDIGRAINATVSAVAGTTMGVEIIPEDGMMKYQVTLPTPKGTARVTAMTSNPTRFRSKGGDVGLDEFAFHKDAQAMYDAAYACITWGGQLSIISSHNGEGSLFNQFVQMARRRRDPATYGEPKPRDIPFELHRTTMVDAISEGLVELINRNRGTNFSREEFLEQIKQGAGAGYDQEFGCVPSGDDSSYLPFSLSRDCVDPKAPAPVSCSGSGVETPNAVWVESLTRFRADIARHAKGASALFVGVDVGRKHDRFVIWALAKFGGTLRTVGVLVWENMPYTAMQNAGGAIMTMRVDGVPRVRRMVADATGIGAQMGEHWQTKFRGRVEAIEITANVKDEVYPLLRRHLEERTVTLPDCTTTLADLQSVKKTLTAAGRVRFAGERGGDGHADRACALALALHAADDGGRSQASAVELTQGVLP